MMCDARPIGMGYKYKRDVPCVRAIGRPDRSGRKVYGVRLSVNRSAKEVLGFEKGTKVLIFELFDGSFVVERDAAGNTLGGGGGTVQANFAGIHCEGEVFAEIFDEKAYFPAGTFTERITS